MKEDEAVALRFKKIIKKSINEKKQGWTESNDG